MRAGQYRGRINLPRTALARDWRYICGVRVRPAEATPALQEAPLQHPTAILVHRRFVHVPAERVDKFQLIRRHPFYQLLNNLFK